jgi:hypothetical protein
MASQSSETPVRNNAQGWGAAAVTVIFTAALAIMAYIIHERTYQSPREQLAHPSAGESSAH